MEMLRQELVLKDKQIEDMRKSTELLPRAQILSIQKQLEKLIYSGGLDSFQFV